MTLLLVPKAHPQVVALANPRPVSLGRDQNHIEFLLLTINLGATPPDWNYSGAHGSFKKRDSDFNTVLVHLVEVPGYPL